MSSVVQACANIAAEIFVVDNNSTDGSKAFFHNRFPQVNFIWKNENAGFAKANNEALKLATGEKILFLNPDTILPEDCLEKCLHFFKQQNNIGALGVKMIDGSGNFLPESKRGFPSFFTSFCKMTGLTNLFPTSKIFARYYLGHLPENETNEVDILSGACMMIDKKVLDVVGSFDEAYFMYAEDIDLSYRIQKAGYKNFYFADTVIIHFKGESVTRQSAAYIRNFYGTMVLFIKKHYSKITGFIYSSVIRLLMLIKLLFSKSAVAKTETPFDTIHVLWSEETYTTVQPLLLQHFRSSYINSAIKPIQKKQAVLLCVPYHSYKQIISTLHQFKNGYSFFIYAAACQSIIGSSHKTSPGQIFILK